MTLATGARPSFDPCAAGTNQSSHEVALRTLAQPSQGRMPGQPPPVGPSQPFPDAGNSNPAIALVGAPSSKYEGGCKYAHRCN